MPACIRCEGCGSYVLTPRWSRRFCDTCKSVRRKLQTQQHVAAHRQRKRNGEEMPVSKKQERDRDSSRTAQRKIRTEGGHKVVPLPCGHELRFSIAPIEGEELWCVRCGDYRELTYGMKRSLCRMRIHRMTPFNTEWDAATGQHACRKCIEEA